MVTIQISEDLLVWVQSQLKGLQEAVQRLQEQVAAQKGNDQTPTVTPSAAEMKAAVAAPPSAGTEPSPEGGASPPRQPLRLSPKEAVAEAVGRQTGAFGVGAIKQAFRGTLNSMIPDSTIRRLLEEMTGRGELVRVSQATGRAGNKYRLTKTAAGQREGK